MKRLLVMMSALALVGCLDSTGPNSSPSDPLNETFATSLGIDLHNDPAWHQLDIGIFYKDEVVGDGASLVLNSGYDSVYVDYEGYLKDGTSFGTGTNAGFLAGGVLPGFIYGMVNMNVGGTRYVVIPSEYGYGNAKVNDIPPNSTLVFRITLNKFVNTGT